MFVFVFHMEPLDVPVAVRSASGTACNTTAPGSSFLPQAWLFIPKTSQSVLLCGADFFVGSNPFTQCCDVAISADPWPDHIRLSDLEPRFVCTACGQRGADIRPDFHRDKPARLRGNIDLKARVNGPAPHATVAHSPSAC